MNDAIAARFRKGRLNPPEAAEYLTEVHGTPIAHATLNKLRSVGGGPEFQKFGRAVLYPRTALDEWALARLGEPRASTAGQ
ncbi:MAG: DNA-binding protein [Novosphingobium sp.]|nr:DNA-binding protein [Novosphingobium sp.]